MLSSNFHDNYIYLNFHRSIIINSGTTNSGMKRRQKEYVANLILNTKEDKHSKSIQLKTVIKKVYHQQNWWRATFNKFNNLWELVSLKRICHKGLIYLTWKLRKKNIWINSQWIAVQWQLITGSTDTYVIYATWLTEYSLHQNKTVLQIKDVNGYYVIMDQVNNCIYGKVSMKRKVDKKSSY